MFKKFFAVMLIAGLTVSAFAADIVALDLNFYSEEETSVKTAGELPEGIVMNRRIRFRNPALHGFAYPVRIDLGKTKTIDLTFNVTGNGAISPSLHGYSADDNGKVVKKLKFKCTALEFCGEPSSRPLPFLVEQWTNMLPWGIRVSDGDTVTIKATFETVE